MNALYVIHKYLDIKAGNIPARQLQSSLVGKLLRHTIAQDIIHLILCLSEVLLTTVSLHALKSSWLKTTM